MDNADSDHSLTWEDFYGSTTDLTPTLMGIFNTFLDSPTQTTEPQIPVAIKRDEVKRKMDAHVSDSPSKDPRLIAGGVKLPGLSRNEEPSPPTPPTPISSKKTSPPKMSYVSRLKSFGLRKSVSESKDDNAVSPQIDVISKINDEVIAKAESRKNSSFENLSPNVKKIISCADDLVDDVKPKKPNLARSSYRSKHSIIPLMGATSKITQSSMEIETVTADIYDKPAKNNLPSSTPRSSVGGIRFVSPTQSSLINKVAKDWTLSTFSPPETLPKATLSTFSPKSASPQTSPSKLPVYDTPVAKIPAAIYDVPSGSKKLPYIDQSLEGGAEKEEETKAPEHQQISDRLSVIRPLSMSSIASSTSTSSSSGNQNKGANSAYLASIESLDDHSDMDYGKNHPRLTQINGIVGSNLTVDSTDGGNGSSKTTESNQQSSSRPTTPPRPRYCDPSLSLLQRVCTEIVDTENVYVEDLRQVVEGYLHFWRKEEIFSPEQLSDIFSNVEEIYMFNKNFSEHLNKCNLEAVAIARCFVHHSSGFGIYTQYCTDYPGIMAALARLLRDPESAQPFRTRQATLGHALPLGSYLLKPVQRILKYHLLLQNLVKQYKSHDTEYALNKMTTIAYDINEMKRRHEHSVRVQEIQSLLYGWNGQDLTTFGELCAEGTFRVFGAKAMRHAFLFDKMLLLTKNKEFGMLAYKSHIMCNNLMLVESIQGQPLSFHVIPFDCPRMQVTLQAKSIQHKREWTLLLKRNILENYNAVIPSHARQLVMELGQNKTDDDIIAEKSSTLISHSSIRKQLGAPEYLEKRKLERDRRKSFESGFKYRLKKNANRKEHTDNDESEKEQSKDISDFQYTCADCDDIKNSNMNICEDCDDNFICTNCIADNCAKDGNCNEKHHCVCYNCSRSDSMCDKLNDEIILHIKSNHNCSMSGRHICDKSKENDVNMNSDLKKTCLKCHEIKENIMIPHDNTESNSLLISEEVKTSRKNCDHNLQSNECHVCGKKTFICKSCSRSLKNHLYHRDRSLSPKNRKFEAPKSPILEIKMYNAKTVPKKISKLKKNRAKTMRHLTVDPTAKFYTDFQSDFVSDNILHISESNESINDISKNDNNEIKTTIEVPTDMDEEMYKSLIQKTDSFKKSELEKDKIAFLNKQTMQENIEKDINDVENPVEVADDDVFESCDDGTAEKPLEQIISQLLMQNREFQKILKRHQMRSNNNRRHQRLMKSHSNPEKVFIQNKDQIKTKPKFGRQLSAIESNTTNLIDIENSNAKNVCEEPIYETLIPSTVSKENEQLQSVKESTENNPESDYVYLCFDDRRNINAYKLPNEMKNLNIDNGIGEYAVPKKPKQVYEEVEVRHSKNTEDNYENTSDIWKRISKDTVIENKAFKNTVNNNISDTEELQSPNIPKIWLNNQKEHFTTPKEKKSGSLPRSFQVHNDQIATIYQNKPGNLNKMYLNKDGKVMQTDRPFTIASDHSEISYDDIERFIRINDNSDLKFPQKQSVSSYSIMNNENIDEIFESVTRSTLELEAEIDRCYNNKFGTEQDHFKDAMNRKIKNNESISSSLEVINDKLECETSQEDITNSLHPEHKIYKPTNSNLLSFKGVLNRFKSKNRSHEQAETETKQKKALKNGKNLFQRLKSMRSDENEDTSCANPTVTVTNVLDTEIVTSKSFCENVTSNLNDVEPVSKSCININTVNEPSKIIKTTNNSNNHYMAMNKISKSTQELNKLPIYKQGSRLLGARIAQSDYADPKLLMDPTSDTQKANFLINKTAVRPDSVLSNSSYITSSSDGYMTANTDCKNNNLNNKSDESFYEKSFEEIEKMFNGDEIFRDSAIYSDPEDGIPCIDLKANEISNKIIKPLLIKGIETEKTLKSETKCETQSIVILKEKTKAEISKLPEKINVNKSTKLAPPIPVKPLMTRNNGHHLKPQYTKFTISNPNKANLENNKPIIEDSSRVDIETSHKETLSTTKNTVYIPKPNFTRSISTSCSGNIKRMSYERCSFDSSIINRKVKSVSYDRTENESLIVSKSVQERRKEIEMLANKSVEVLESSVVLNRSYSMKTTQSQQLPFNKLNSTKCNIPVRHSLAESKIIENVVKDDNNGNENGKGWVKQVVNRFQ